MNASPYDFTPKPMGQLRGQGTIEYVLIIAAVLMVVALTASFLLNNILRPQTQTLGNQSDKIKGYKNQLAQQIQSIGPSGTPTPTSTASPGH